MAGATLGIVDASLEQSKHVSTAAVYTVNNTIIRIASNHSGARKKTYNWFEHVQPATTEESKKMCEYHQPGLKYPPFLSKKHRVVGKKKSDDKKLSGTHKQRIKFVKNVCRQKDYKDMEEYVNSIVRNDDFQCVSVDKTSRKSYKFKVFACDVSVSYLIQMCDLKA